ncbi:hypothetical protein T11_4177 [Trichinella zimbabwensis]|uniref:Uncharacterized protein n=1 Tax=Trichinella zimbabwensis TaxID=268475 RepID=A0A0V1GHY4_9BILA|nr:hypothetical protein T11_4177 [Trichinella zimbabwensis]
MATTAIFDLQLTAYNFIDSNTRPLVRTPLRVDMVI